MDFKISREWNVILYINFEEYIFIQKPDNTFNFL